LPRIRAKSLDGHEITIPGDSKVQAFVISFGFSHKSDKAVEDWDKRIGPLYANDTRVAYYEMPVLEGVPGMVKPFILHGMKRAVPKKEHSRFAPLYHNESALKKVVGFEEAQPAAAYVVVATSRGKVVWASHAPVSDAEFETLQKAVAGLLQ